MGRLAIRGKYLFDGEGKFYARGVSYGPFTPNSRGERYPEPERADADFALMREFGVNLVRTYVPPPPWMFELAAKHSLRLFPGMPWPFHMAFLDSAEMTREIRATIRREVTAMREFGEVIFAYSLGNEIRSDIVRWHGPREVSRFLAELYDIGKAADPDGLFTYANYPSTEYLDLSFLDLVCFNVYLHREVDFRRYLTHVLAETGDRPLVLSETGLDTIREGEEHQAELLGWQARAAFELGLSGFIVFAFTDEWHTGGAEITDWAFGLTTRERKVKPAFVTVGEIFRDALPPPRELPRAAVVVAAYNAAATLSACLASLARLNYPGYEVIVVDDGSSDDTAAIATAAGVRVVGGDHRGLGAARNAGIAAASGSLIAFLDADAEADRDWLYHLGETITRRAAGAVGGQNFPPPPAAAVAQALAVAPGAPREVRAEADNLEQVCGCSMALDRSKFPDANIFDPAFQTAGDDVDFSWRLTDAGQPLAYAPGAVAIHRRRPTVGAYLRQQSGYGHAEGLLYRKYPRRGAARNGLYGGAGWFAAWFGSGSRVYYGAFGRGLFQTVYRNATLPLAAQLSLTIQWVLVAVLLIIAGLANPVLGFFGWTGIALTVITAIAAAVLEPARLSLGGRAILAFLGLAGPLVRSYQRARVVWQFKPDTAGAPATAAARSGRLELQPLTDGGDGPAPSPGELVEALRVALIRRGAAVARTDGYEPYDLAIHLPPCVRVPLMVLTQDGGIALAWRTTAALKSLGIAGLIILIGLLLAGASTLSAVAAIIILGLIAGAIALMRTRRVAALISAAAHEVAAACGMRVGGA